VGVGGDSRRGIRGERISVATGCCLNWRSGSEKVFWVTVNWRGKIAISGLGLDGV
jgi:hypothetical protein